MENGRREIRRGCISDSGGRATAWKTTKTLKTVRFSDVKTTPLSALLICSAVGVVRHALDPPLTSSHPPVVEGSELVIHSKVCTHNKSFNIPALL